MAIKGLRQIVQSVRAFGRGISGAPDPVQPNLRDNRRGGRGTSHRQPGRHDQRQNKNLLHDSASPSISRRLSNVTPLNT